MISDAVIYVKLFDTTAVRVESESAGGKILKIE